MQRPAPDPRDDASLIDAANRGDADAFAALYLRYRDWVVGLARRWTGDNDLALDVLQDTFLYVLRKLPGLALRSSFRSFLYPAVRHVAITRRARARRDAAGGALDADAVADDPPGLDASRAELAAALGALPAAQREVVLMRFVDGMELAEIADARDVPLGTIKSRLHHALRTLRDDPRTRSYFLP